MPAFLSSVPNIASMYYMYDKSQKHYVITAKYKNKIENTKTTNPYEKRSVQGEKQQEIMI